MTVAKQLLKEFWMPAVGAVVWILFSYTTATRPQDVGSLVGQFSAAFFFFSWMTGQIFRVSKQARTEKSFTAIEARVGDLVSDLQRETKQLKDLATGGDGFAYFIFTNSDWDNPKPFATIEGSNPLYGVKARVTDVQKFERLPQKTFLTLSEAEKVFDLGDMTPGYGAFISSFPPFEPGIQDYNIAFSARNGGWTQLTRARRVDGTWTFATLVTRDAAEADSTRAVLLARKDNAFPSAALPTGWPQDVATIEPS